MPGIAREHFGCAVETVRSSDLDPIALDHRVGEQAVAHRLHIRFGLGAVIAGDVELDGLADTGVADAGEAEAMKRALDGLALDVKHARLEENLNFSAH